LRVGYFERLYGTGRDPQARITLAVVLFFFLSAEGVKQLKKQKGTAVSRSGWQASGEKNKEEFAWALAWRSSLFFLGVKT